MEQETLNLKYYDELRWLWDIIDKCEEGGEKE